MLISTKVIIFLSLHLGYSLNCLSKFYLAINMYGMAIKIKIDPENDSAYFNKGFKLLLNKLFPNEFIKQLISHRNV